MSTILSTDKPVLTGCAVTPSPQTPPAPSPAAVPNAAVAPLDYQLEAKPVSRRRYRRVLWLCGAGWLALAVILASYGVWNLRRAAASANGVQAVANMGKSGITIYSTQRVAPVVVYNPRTERRDRIKSLMEGPARHTGEVVYEEDPAAAGKLLTSPSPYAVADSSHAGRPQGYQPPAFLQAASIDSDGQLRFNQNDPAELFRGPLKSPAGNSRLVRIALKMQFGGQTSRTDRAEPKAQQIFSLTRQLAFEIYRADSNDMLNRVRSGDSLKIAQPKGQDIPVRWVDGVLCADRAAEHNVRFFAGQLDPADPSHFTIDYELNGEKNVIDGWLTDDDFLRIRPRGGKVVGGDWLIAEKP